MQMKCYTSFMILFIVAGLWSCSGRQQTVQPPPPIPVAVKQTVEPAPASNNEGSLWQARSSMNGLFIDTKARNVGDIVTIKIDENAKATNKADTKTGRSSSLEAGIEKLFGLEDWWQNDIHLAKDQILGLFLHSLNDSWMTVPCIEHTDTCGLAKFP